MLMISCKETSGSSAQAATSRYEHPGVFCGTHGATSHAAKWVELDSGLESRFIGARGIGRQQRQESQNRNLTLTLKGIEYSSGDMCHGVQLEYQRGEQESS